MSLISNKAQIAVIDAFAKDLESSLGVVQERISFKELWESTAPKEANSLSLDEYMEGVS
jgi:hypothetical protein